MTLPTPDELRDLSRDELIAVILVLMEQVRQLPETVEQLQAENERLKPPPTSSHNSSQPPSRDWKADTRPASGYARSSAAPNRAMPKPNGRWSRSRTR